MAVAKAKAAARSPTREELPEARMPERAPARAPDPNAILTRDGRAVDMERIKSQSDDRFDIGALGIFAPKGWSYEWRTRTVKGAVWTDAIAEDEQRGWTPVPANRHDGKIMPRGYDGPIERGGLMLMERDERLTAMSVAYQKRDANEQLNISRSMTGLMQRANPNVDMLFDQSDASAQSATGVKITRVPMGDPKKNYTYSLDE